MCPKTLAYAFFCHYLSIDTIFCPLKKAECHLKDKYPNFEVGLKCILIMFPYLLLCSYINENTMLTKNAHECYLV